MAHEHRRHQPENPRPANSAPSVLQRLILLAGLAIAIGSGVEAYRISGPYGEVARDDPRVRRFFDTAGRIRMLVYDADGDGQFDTWSYMDGERLLRIEIDEDGDGRIDRWEYFNAEGAVERIGLSTAHDGRPDAWQYPTGNRSAKLPTDLLRKP